MRVKARGAVPRRLLLLLWLAVPLLVMGCSLGAQKGQDRSAADPAEAQDDYSPMGAGPVALPGLFRSLGRLALVGQDALFVLDGDTGNVHRLTPPGRRAWGPLWSNQGTWLAFTVTKDGEPAGGSRGSPAAETMTGSLVLAWYDGSRRYTVTELPGPVAPGLYAWSPTADLLAAAPLGSGIWLVRPGYPPSLLLRTDGPVQELAWSPDGSILAYIVGPRPTGGDSVLYTVRLGPAGNGGDALDAPGAGRFGPVVGTPEVRYRAEGSDLRLGGWWPDGGGLLLFHQTGAGGRDGQEDGWRLLTLSLGGPARQLAGTPMARRDLLSWFPGEMRLLTVTSSGSQAGPTPVLAACNVITGQCRQYPAMAGAGTETSGAAVPWARAVTAGVVAPTGDRVALVSGPVEGNDGFAPSPGGSNGRTPVADDVHNLWVAGTDDQGADARPLATGGTGPLSVPRWSGDGRFLLYVQDNTLWLHPVDGEAEPHPLVSPWQLPRRQASEGAGKAAGAGQDLWVSYLAWHQPVLGWPGEDRSGRVGPILVQPLAQRGPDGIVTVAGKVTVSVAAPDAQRVEFYAAPQAEEGLGVLFGDDMEPVEGRFSAAWEPPIGGEIFKLTAVVYGDEETKRRTLLVRGSPEPAPDGLAQLFSSMHPELVVQQLQGLPREFAAQGWLGSDRILGSVGPFLAQHQPATGKTSALGVTGLEAGPSPGSSLVAYLGPDQTIYALDVDEGARHLLWSMDAAGRHDYGQYLKPLWSPTGAELLVPVMTTGEPEHYVVRLSPPGVERLSTFKDGYLTTEVIGWAGPQHLIFNAIQIRRLGRVDPWERGTDIFVYHLVEHRYEPLTASIDTEAVTAIAAGPGGIVFRRDKGNGTTYGLMNRQGRVLWEKPLGKVLAAAPSPDGRAVAYIKEIGQERDGSRLLLALHRDGREVELAELLAAEEVTGPFWSPNGLQLLLSFNSYVGGGHDDSPLAGPVAYYTVILQGAPPAGSP